MNTTMTPLTEHVLRFDTPARARAHLINRHPTPAVLRALGERNLDIRDLDLLHLATHKHEKAL